MVAVHVGRIEGEQTAVEPRGPAPSDVAGELVSKQLEIPSHPPSLVRGPRARIDDDMASLPERPPPGQVLPPSRGIPARPACGEALKLFIPRLERRIPLGQQKDPHMVASRRFGTPENPRFVGSVCIHARPVPRVDQSVPGHQPAEYPVPRRTDQRGPGTLQPLETDLLVEQQVGVVVLMREFHRRASVETDPVGVRVHFPAIPEIAERRPAVVIPRAGLSILVQRQGDEVCPRTPGFVRSRERRWPNGLDVHMNDRTTHLDPDPALHTVAPERDRSIPQHEFLFHRRRIRKRMAVQVEPKPAAFLLLVVLVQIATTVGVEEKVLTLYPDIQPDVASTARHRIP